VFKRIELGFLAWELFYKFRYVQNKVTTLSNFASNSGPRKFRHDISRSCCQQNASTVGLVDHTDDGRRVVTHITDYTSVDCNAVTLLL